MLGVLMFSVITQIVIVLGVVVLCVDMRWVSPLNAIRQCVVSLNVLVLSVVAPSVCVT
jgi:hypothetical protein